MDDVILFTTEKLLKVTAGPKTKIIIVSKKDMPAPRPLNFEMTDPKTGEVVKLSSME